MLTGLWSAYPAKLAGLSGRKGALAAGYDADIVVRQTVPSSSRRFASAHACLKAVRKMLPGVGPGCSCRHEHRAPAAPPQGDRLQGRAAARPRARHLCARAPGAALLPCCCSAWGLALRLLIHIRVHRAQVFSEERSLTTMVCGELLLRGKL